VRATRGAVALGLAVALSSGGWACAGASEQPVVAQFFAASRLLDRTALANVATVVFDPRTDGTVTSFAIDAVSRERREGAVATKAVTVSARVRPPVGEPVVRTFVLTLREIEGRWMVVDFRPRAPTP
jgi:hypothetical protein